MRGGPGLLAEREEHVDRASLGARAGSTREIASARQRAGQCVGRVVHGDAGRLQEDLGVEPAVEQELGGVVASTRQRGEQVRRGRLLAMLFGEVLGDSA